MLGVQEAPVTKTVTVGMTFPFLIVTTDSSPSQNPPQSKIHNKNPNFVWKNDTKS